MQTAATTITEQDAQARAAALDAALSEGITAEAHYLVGAWYVVTSGTREGYDFAYPAEDVDVAEVLAPGWNFGDWWERVLPTEDLEVAIEYYVGRARCGCSTRLLGAAVGCEAILTDKQIETLDVAIADGGVSARAK
jgi:hypothetical protein